MFTIQVSRAKHYRSPLHQGPGPEWKWIYYLPEREVEMPDGRIAKTEPGGYSTKSETVTLARKIYTERPMRMEFPDGTAKEIKK
jgi:hypothetical protein